MSSDSYKMCAFIPRSSFPDQVEEEMSGTSQTTFTWKIAIEMEVLDGHGGLLSLSQLTLI